MERQPKAYTCDKLKRANPKRWLSTLPNPNDDGAVDDLVEAFVDIGLEEPEARIYVQLARLGPSKVRTIAEAAGTQRTKTYRVLDDLEERGFVMATMENPTRYEAERADRVFERLIAEEKHVIERLDEARGRLVPKLEELRAEEASPPTGGPGFRTLDDRTSIYRTLSEMFEQAEDRVRVISTHPSSLGSDEISGLRRTLLPRLQEGEVRLDIIYGHDAEPPDERVARIDKLPSVRGRRWSTDRTVRFVLQDEAAVLMFVVSDPGGDPRDDEVAIWTDAPALIDSQLALFETVWASAEPLERDES